MLLSYVDESYSQDWYYMAALLCDGPGAQALTSALDEIIDRAIRTHGVTENAELHGYELYQGEGWWAGIPPRVRIGVYNDVFEAVRIYSRAIILRGLHRAGQRLRYAVVDPPHSVVLLHLLEQIDEYAQRQHEHVLVIADEVGEQAKHRNDLALYRRSGTWGYKSRKLTQVVDTLHFAPSHASRLLQAIDLIVYLYRRLQTHTEPVERAKRANERLWERLTPVVAHSWTWYPMPGAFKNAAIKSTKAPPESGA